MITSSNFKVTRWDGREGDDSLKGKEQGKKQNTKTNLEMLQFSEDAVRQHADVVFTEQQRFEHS